MTISGNTISASLNEQAIRESFFLNSDVAISAEFFDTVKKCLTTEDYRRLIPYTSGHHHDEFFVHITHDIDWLSPYHPYSIIKYCRSLFMEPKWLSLKQLGNPEVFLQAIRDLISLEQEHTIRGLFCIGATKGWQLHPHDIRYSTNQQIFQQLVDVLLSSQCTIGLHSSFNADRHSLIQQERKNLNSFLKKPVTAHRSHYLQFQPNHLYPQLEKAGIQYDFGYGMAREIGFRNGFPGKYKPIDPATGNVVDVTVIPLILLDNVFFVKPYHEVMKTFRKTLEQLKQYRGSACILFHPENMILKPQLWNYFEEIIHICKEEGAKLNPPL